MKVPLSWSNLLILNFEILILFWFHLIGFSTSMVDRIYFNLLQFTQFTSIINQFTHFDVSRFWIVHDWTFWCRILPGLQSQQLQSCAQAPKSLGSRSSCANSKSSGSGTKRKTQPRFTDQNHQVLKWTNSTQLMILFRPLMRKLLSPPSSRLLETCGKRRHGFPPLPRHPDHHYWFIYPSIFSIYK